VLNIVTSKENPMVLLKNFLIYASDLNYSSTD